MAGMGDIADELESVARHLRAAGETELLRELTRAMRDAVDPVPDKVRAGLKPKLPNPYAATLEEDVRLGVNVRTTGRDPGVSLTAATRSRRARRLRNLDEGRLTHPLFGDRDGHWYTQREPSVRPGWFTGPAQDAGPRVRAELEKALEDVSVRAAGKGA